MVEIERWVGGWVGVHASLGPCVSLVQASDMLFALVLFCLSPLPSCSPQPPPSAATDRRSGHATPLCLLWALGHPATQHHQLFLISTNQAFCLFEISLFLHISFPSHDAFCTLCKTSTVSRLRKKILLSLCYCWFALW